MPALDIAAVEQTERTEDARGIQARDFAEYAVVPDVGLLSLRFPVDDARVLAAQIVARGWPLYAPPMPLAIAPYGQVVLFSVRTPDGAILEFHSTMV